MYIKKNKNFKFLYFLLLILKSFFIINFYLKSIHYTNILNKQLQIKFFFHFSTINIMK